MPRHSSHLLKLATHGAEVRLRELAREARYLLALFPHLRDSFDADELPVGFLIAQGAGRTSVPPTARRHTSAARRAATRRTKHDWSERRHSKSRS